MVLHIDVNDRIFRQSFFTNLGNQLQCTAEVVSKALKDLFFVLIVLVAAENKPRIHVKQVEVWC